MDREAWRVAAHGVTKSRPWLSNALRCTREGTVCMLTAHRQGSFVMFSDHKEFFVDEMQLNKNSQLMIIFYILLVIFFFFCFEFSCFLFLFHDRSIYFLGNEFFSQWLQDETLKYVSVQAGGAIQVTDDPRVPNLHEVPSTQVPHESRTYISHNFSNTLALSP